MYLLVMYLEAQISLTKCKSNDKQVYPGHKKGHIPSIFNIHNVANPACA